MYRVKRVKRDSAENIYRHCKLSGTCPPDVENKIEQNNTNYELNEYKLGLSSPFVRIFCEILTNLAKITHLSLTPKLRHFGL